ncbi:DUF1800 family protein [Vibrio crassostreae]|uniref:DUF1800 family protein n=1 Tax=Vibrio crassostreae TaxID=246167 RepID=UPI002FE39FBC
MVTTKRAHQVLLQATMGFKSTDVDNLIEADDIESWIDIQTTIGGSSLVNKHRFVAERHSDPGWSDVHLKLAYTDILLKNGALLRHRMAYILTQLFVVSFRDPQLDLSHRRIASSKYYDNLANNCFGSFRDLLKIISTSPVMGEYLTFRGNNFKEGVAADENFAREVMQLFTIGPALLNMDGTVITDSAGKPVLSYSQQDIEEAAKVMTGWNLHNDDWLQPMRAVEDLHNQESKLILGNHFPAGATAEADLEQLLDTLCAHQNIAPFVAKFFIQKMITSNPSKDYVYRVAKAFKDSQLDMQVLIKAILTDEQASYVSGRKDDGLIRDPMITLSHAFRALNLTLKPGNEIFSSSYAWSKRRVLFHAPSVFYHYQPDEAPNDDRFTGIAAPEFKIYNWDDVYHYFRQVSDLATRLESEPPVAYMNRPTFERHFQDAGNPNSINNLIDELDKHLFANNMSEGMKSVIHEYMTTANRNNLNVLKALLIQIIMSPEFMTQG